MTGEELLDLAERGLSHARGETQATAIHERSLLSRFAGSHPTQATEVDEVELHVTAVRAGHTAVAVTNRLDDAALREAVRQAERAAQAAAAAGPGAYPGLPAPGPAPEPHGGFDEATARLEPAEAGEALRAVFDVAAERRLEAAGALTAGAVRTAIASSTGLRAIDAVTDAYLKVLCRDAGGRSGFASRTAKSSAALSPAATAHEAAAKVVAGEPVELPPGEYPAVLEAQAMGTLLDFLGELAFNGLAFAEGRSALSGRLEDQVAAPGVNLSDSPRFRRTLPRAFDAEGVTKAPLPLIQDGVAYAVVHDTRSAAIAGGSARSTGHAIAPGGAPDGPRPTNLVMIGGGAAGVDELAAPIERGIYVTRLWYTNPVHPKETLLTGMTRDGTFLIEDGRISRPLRDVRFTDSVLRLLSGAEALSARTRLVSDPELYGRRFAYGVVCPAIRVSGLRVTGATVA